MKKLSLMVLMFLLAATAAYAENTTEYERLISYLDLSAAELSGVKEYADAADYEAAAQEFISYYSQRKTPEWSEMPQKPFKNTSYDTVDADNIKNLMMSYNGGLISVDNGDGTVNWNLKPDGQKEWMWALNRHFQFVTLSRAYLNTSDVSYASAFERQFNDWYENNPKPQTLDTDSTWRTLEAGIRISSMISYFNNFVMSDDLSLITKTRILISLHEHGEYLAEYSGTNNWLLIESKGFYSLVYMFPEFKKSSEWKGIVFQRLNDDFSAQFLDDGWQHELTPNYHIESVKSIAAIQSMANKNGDSLPYETELMKSYASTQAIMGAGLFVLPLNDTHNVLQSDFMYSGAELSEKLNAGLTGGFISSASGGLYGKPEAATKSVLYKNSGYAVMRGGSGKNAVSAFFETGASGVGGHGWMSRDKLQFTLTAFDRDLLIDTGGSTTYGDDPLSKYTYTTPAHNTVTIDGYDQVRRNSDNFTADAETKFITSDRLEYAQGIYNEKYDETKLIDVVHKRKIAFVKSEYFVIRDELSGNGSHTARQYWNLAPGKYIMDESTGAVRTDFEDGKNVMIIPLNFSGKESSCGGESPMRGWTSTGNKTLNFCYKKNFTDSGCIETVIIPYRGRIAPEVNVSEETGKIKIDYKDFTDTVCFDADSVSVERIYDGGEAEIIDFESTAEEPEQDYKIIPCSGTIQAEWSGFENSCGDYHFDSSAKGKAYIRLNSGAYQVLRTSYGMTSLTIRAKGKGTLKINNSALEINSEEFCDYTVYGIEGGKIKVLCSEGSIALDRYTFKGTGKSINLHALRYRLPEASIMYFAQSSSEIKTVSADFTPVSCSSAEDKVYYGFKIGDYEIRYNMSDNMFEIYCDGKLINSCRYYLNYGKTYNVSLDIGNEILVSVDGKEIIKEVYSSSDSTAGIFISGVDLYIDNVSVNGNTETYEGKNVGDLYGSDKKWVVEGIENQCCKPEIICNSTAVLPGTKIKMQFNNADNAVLLKNGEEVSYSDNEYIFTADEGIYTFCLKKDDMVSEPIIITAQSDLFVKSVYVSERFDASTTENKWNGRNFVYDDGKWQLKGVKSEQSEVYIDLPSEAGNKISLECDFLPESDTDNIKLFMLRDSSNRELNTVKFSAGGSIADSITNEQIGMYSSSVINHIRIDYDFNNGSYSVYNNGELLALNRKMSVQVSGMKRIYAAIIWNGSSGLYISDFKMNILEDLPSEIAVKKTVGESESFSRNLKFMSNEIYSAEYDDRKLVSLKVINNGETLNLDDRAVTLFDWDNMVPKSLKTESYFSLTPGFSEENYFCQNFDTYSGGLPSSRWGGSKEYLSSVNGMMFMGENSSGISEIYYNCLDNLEGKISVEADIMAQTDKTDITLFTYRDASGGESPLLQYRSDGKIYTSDNVPLGVYNAGEFNKIRVEIDTNSKLYNVWSDGILLMKDIPLTGNSAGIKRVYLAKIYMGNSGVLIDNFIVSKNSE